MVHIILTLCFKRLNKHYVCDYLPLCFKRLNKHYSCEVVTSIDTLKADVVYTIIIGMKLMRLLEKRKNSVSFRKTKQCTLLQGRYVALRFPYWVLQV
jgi:hypothetical protein